MSLLLFSDKIRVLSKKIIFLSTVALKALKLLTKGRFTIRPHVLTHSSEHVFINGYVAVYILYDNALWYRFPGQLITTHGGLKLIPISALKSGMLNIQVFGLFQKKEIKLHVVTEQLNALSSNLFRATFDRLKLYYTPQPVCQSFVAKVKTTSMDMRLSLRQFSIQTPNITIDNTPYKPTNFLWKETSMS